MHDLYALSAPELKALLQSWGQKPFRAKQLRKWLYESGAATFEEMSDLPAALRERLRQEATLGTLELAAEQVSTDGTTKRVWRLPDGQLIESVLMPYRSSRRTACISSQAGCAMRCAFCATGQMGFARQLTADEIVEQALIFHRELLAQDQRLSNVVLMGMGEPFHNYDAVLEAVRRINTDLGIGARHITVSTVGLVPQIRRFAEAGLQATLAVSLHAATDAERSAIMPINKRWPLAELIAACRDYVEATNRRVTFEWALIRGVNDGVAVAERLGALLQGLHCHVNLIPLNPTSGYDGAPSDPEAVEAFVAALARFGVPATVRVRRGIDIDAGCGQLKSKVLQREKAAEAPR
ncbi:MAG: 23S rRNA (adenine(2503)-C(2))-methyltransferase RlmN [Alphaproteobacteria bacterium]|nr:23S rRNA (adenine(2503)-C(2))-methyltransferase RlmN [Alphaproteobacteria bacterium]MCB9792758.1 23S rRNA (adenine(2503)-C(2))-methyltransferase RlmN [Alphaproteobacteria bacterium]